MATTSKHQKCLQTEALKQYAYAMGQLQKCHYNKNKKNLLGLSKNKTRRLIRKSEHHRWVIHSLQNSAVINEGATISSLMDELSVSRSTILSILDDLLDQNLIFKMQKKNQKNYTINYYIASDELLESYLEYVLGFVQRVRELRLHELYNQLMVNNKTLF